MSYPMSEEQLNSLEKEIRGTPGLWDSQCQYLINEIRIMKAHKEADDKCFERISAIAHRTLGLSERKKGQLEALTK